MGDIVRKIVLTGGPCAGKTTAKQYIQKTFTDRGLCVLFAGETATELYGSGITDSYCRGMFGFEVALVAFQKQKEDIFAKTAERTGRNTLLVCDRGVLDAKAYLSPAEFSLLLDQFHTSEAKELSRYEAVFHLVTAAEGAEEHYTRDNNPARRENAAQAREKDRQIRKAWEPHPYFRIIGNGSSFVEKMNTLVEEIEQFLETTS